MHTFFSMNCDAMMVLIKHFLYGDCYCLRSLLRVVRGSKLMHLDSLIHGLFYNLNTVRLLTTFISDYYYLHIYRLAIIQTLQAFTMYMNIDEQCNCGAIPLLSAFPFLVPFRFPLLTWNPPCCDRILSTSVPSC
jgi:hypothetical protein